MLQIMATFALTAAEGRAEKTGVTAHAGADGTARAVYSGAVRARTQPRADEAGCCEQSGLAPAVWVQGRTKHQR